MTSALDIIRALGGNESTGMCTCPAHDDHTPSLHVSQGRKAAIWKCQAGCSQDDVLQALRSRGVLRRSERNAAKKPAVDEREADEEETHKRWEHTFAILRRAAQPARKKERKLLKPYFKARGIDWIPKNARLLHPEDMKALDFVPFKNPALVFPVWDGQRCTPRI
jgi:hypothetical protein